MYILREINISIADCYYKNVSISSQQNKTLSFNGSPYNCKCVDDNDGNVPYFMCTKDCKYSSEYFPFIVEELSIGGFITFFLVRVSECSEREGRRSL